jgi:GNAT superfamily N-acetyltransferase
MSEPSPSTSPSVEVDYSIEPGLLPDEFVDVLQRSTLAERRPVADSKIIARMLASADVIVTARVGGKLVGVSRALSDFAFCTYLSDLAVDEGFQRRGIGRELIRRTHAAAGLHTSLILLAAPKAKTYYPHIGMTQHESCWWIPRDGSAERNDRP